MLAHTVTLMHVPWTLLTVQVGAPELELDDDTVVEEELTVELDELEVAAVLVVVVVVVEELETDVELELAFGPLLDEPVVISEPVLPPAPPAAMTLPPRPSVVVLVTTPPMPVDPDERPPSPSVPETRPGL
jgi:hypothetical protein